MTLSCRMGEIGARRGARAMLAAALVFLLAIFAGSALAYEDELSDEDRDCLSCHGETDAHKTLEDGRSISMYISPKIFATSVHAEEGCFACHIEDPDTHPDEGSAYGSLREYGVDHMEAACSGCHVDAYNHYQDSVHASVLAAGSQKVAICSDCHNPHSVGSPYAPEAHLVAATCQSCHEDVGEAHMLSVHGEAAGDSAAVCSDCHSFHNIKAPSLGNEMQAACVSCHTDALATHSDWLPRTERHFESISCTVCHSPGAAKVNLKLYDAAGGQQLSERGGAPRLQKLASAVDNGGNGLTSAGLWKVLGQYNSEGPRPVLRGRLDPASGMEAHRMGAASEAVRDCTTCHNKNALAFKQVSLSLEGPDGRAFHYSAEPEVLHSISSVIALSGFYVIGSTRIKILDILLVLTLMAGIGIAVGHFSIRWAFRKLRERDAAAATAAGDLPIFPSRDDGPGGDDANK